MWSSARENLRSRSPNGRVNNLSVCYQARALPPPPPCTASRRAERFQQKIWSCRVPRSMCFSARAHTHMYGGHMVHMWSPHTYVPRTLARSARPIYGKRNAHHVQRRRLRARISRFTVYRRIINLSHGRVVSPSRHRFRFVSWLFYFSVYSFFARSPFFSSFFDLSHSPASLRSLFIVTSVASIYM